jgi:hypothetical protein
MRTTERVARAVKRVPVLVRAHSILFLGIQSPYCPFMAPREGDLGIGAFISSHVCGTQSSLQLHSMLELDRR